MKKIISVCLLCLLLVCSCSLVACTKYEDIAGKYYFYDVDAKAITNDYIELTADGKVLCSSLEVIDICVYNSLQSGILISNDIENAKANASSWTFYVKGDRVYFRFKGYGEFIYANLKDDILMFTFADFCFLKEGIENPFVEVDNVRYIFRESQGNTYAACGLVDKSVTTVNIKPSINGIDVTRIARRAFWGGNLESVTIPSSILIIEQSAFYGCKLKNVIFENADSWLVTSKADSGYETTLSGDSLLDPEVAAKYLTDNDYGSYTWERQKD